MRWDFFIAHAKASASFARELHSALVHAGRRVFFDERTPAGIAWDATIGKALHEARVITVIIPEEWQQAFYLREEIGRALALYRQDPERYTLIPIYPNGLPSDPEKIPYGLFILQGVDGSQGIDFVVRRLEELSPQAQPRAALHSTAPAPQADTTPGSRGDGLTLTLTLPLSLDAPNLEAFLRDLANAFELPPQRIHSSAFRSTEGVIVLRGDDAASRSIALALEQRPVSGVVHSWLSRTKISAVRLDSSSGSRDVALPILSIPIAGEPSPLKLELEPWSAIALRRELDAAFLESEVTSTAIAALLTLPCVQAAALWVVRERDGSPQTLFGSAGSADQLDEASSLDRCKDCIAAKRPMLWDASPLIQLFVPMDDLGTLQGAFQLAIEPCSILTQATDTVFNLLCAFGSQIAAALRRARRLQAYRDITRTTAEALVIDRALHVMLEEITNLGFEYAAVFVPDHFRGEIGVLVAKNMAPAWAAGARQPLDHHDIVPYTYRTKTPSAVIEGWNERFDAALYERFEHAELARVFVPVLSDGACVGVVEYGCARSRKNELFTEDNLRKVADVLCRHARADFELARPSMLLQKIARHAISALGADAASIYIYDEVAPQGGARHEAVLAAGAGKADAQFLKQFTPRQDGLGSRALHAKGTVTWTAEGLKRGNAPLYDLGVRALAATPLFFDEQPRGEPRHAGILYVDFRAERHPFTRSERQIMAIFARQVEIAIGNTLLVERARERQDRALRYSRLLEIVKALPGADLQVVLKQIARNVLQLLNADSVVLYEYFQSQREFSRPIITGYFLDRESMDTPMPVDGVARRALAMTLEQGKSLFFDDIEKQADLVEHRHGRTRFVVRELLKSSAVLNLTDDGEVVGIMFVNYRTAPQNFTQSDRAELNTLASSAGIAIGSSRRRKLEEERRRKELGALQAVVTAVTQADLTNLASVLDLILVKGIELVGANAGRILLTDSADNRMRTFAARGLAGDWKGPHGPNGSSRSMDLVDRAVRSKVLQPEHGMDHRAGQAESADQGQVAVPIVDSNRVLGVVHVIKRSGFGALERALLESLARQVVLVMSCIERFEKPVSSERVVSLIREVMHSQRNLESRLRTVLTGITAGQGLGFSRAMIFVRRSSQLESVAAVGPLRRDEAERTWAELTDRMAKLRVDEQGSNESSATRAERILRFLLGLAASDSGSHERSALIEFLNGQGRLALDDPGCAVMRCMTSKAAAIVGAEEGDPLKTMLRERAGESVLSDMVIVPLVHREQSLGVIVVDSEFLPEAQQPTVRERVRSGVERSIIGVLQPFADLASTVIADSRSMQ
jgi:GAF domain-containing protein